MLKVKRYSKNTVGSYAPIVKLVRHFFQKPLEKVDETELNRCFYHMVHTKKVSYSYQKQVAMGKVKKYQAQDYAGPDLVVSRNSLYQSKKQML